MSQLRDLSARRRVPLKARFFFVSWRMTWNDGRDFDQRLPISRRAGHRACRMKCGVGPAKRGMADPTFLLLFLQEKNEKFRNPLKLQRKE
jgi:hypothetical protein